MSDPPENLELNKSVTADQAFGFACGFFKVCRGRAVQGMPMPISLVRCQIQMIQQTRRFLGFRVWGLGFGVGFLGFRVWGLGFGV